MSIRECLPTMLCFIVMWPVIMLALSYSFVITVGIAFAICLFGGMSILKAKFLSHRKIDFWKGEVIIWRTVGCLVPAILLRVVLSA